MKLWNPLRSFFGRGDESVPAPPIEGPPADAAATGMPADDQLGAPPALNAEAPALPVPSGDGAPQGLPGTNDRADTAGKTEPTSKIFYRYYTDIHGTPDHTRAYEHGHVDGTHEGDPDAFRAVIAHAEQVAHLGGRVEQHKANLAEAVRDRDLVRELDTQIASAPRRAEHLAYQRDLCAREKVEALSYLEQAEQDEKRVRDRAPALNLAIYGIAAILLLAGDLVVSKQVVAQVLELKGDFLWINEGWWFAAGIAVLAVIVKLGYERLVEVPYLKGERVWFRRVVLSVVLLTLGTLAVLGWTRSYQANRMKLGRSNSGQTPPSGDSNPFDRQPPASKTAVTESVHPMVTAAFILTAVLFALAGGIAGGVAARSLHTIVAEVRPAKERLAEAQARYARAHAPLETAEQQLAESESVSAERAALRTHYPAFEDLVAQVADGERALQADTERLHEARTLWLTALYDSGFALAEANAVYLDKTPQATMRRLAQLTADVLRAMQENQIAETDGQSLLYALHHATQQHLAGDLTLDGFRSLLGALEMRLAELLAAGPPPAEQVWESATSHGPRIVRTAGARPFIEARQTMARL